MKRIEIVMTEEQYEALRQSALTERLSVGELIRRLLVKSNMIPDAVIKHGGWRGGRKANHLKTMK